MDILLTGLAAISDPMVLAMTVLGLVTGILIGAIPGLNVPLAVAIALPITFNLTPVAGLAMLVGIYKGGTYGGSLSAILINVPGTPAAVATAADGSALTRAGKAGKALKMSLFASVIGELISDIALIAFCVPIAALALKFGPAEMFALGIFALTLVGVLSEGNMVKGLIAGTIGLLLANFGVDPLSGAFRLTFGVRELAGGWAFIALVIGIFAVSEALSMVERSAKVAVWRSVSLWSPENRITRAEWRQGAPAIARSSMIGVLIGTVPGLGSAVAAFLSYGVSRSLSRDPDAFGKGAIDGIASAESGNNAVTGTTFVPLLTLGVPGDVITAIMLGAFMVHGLIPGPALFQQNGDFIIAFFALMLLATVLHFAIGLAGMAAFIQVTRVSRAVLFPIILLLAVTGVYVTTHNVFDIYVMLGFGVLGYLMKVFGFPIAPLLIGFILSPLIEIGFRQAMIVSRGSYDIFFTRPIAAGFLLLALVVSLAVAWREMRRPPATAQRED
ncbi:MAG: tripartite tricarboxylate transporter permease [Acuticoccus sp.]